MQDFNYGFNATSTNNGNVASWTATGQQAFSRSFTYDSLNRLGTLNQSSGSATGCSSTFNLSWTYDAWGNRTDQTVNSGTCNPFHASVNSNNQLSGSPYQYDAAGNMISDGNHTYSYDAENRLIQVDGTLGTCSTATACYLYDALGHRAVKQTGSYYLSYIHDLSGNPVTENCNPCSWGTGWNRGHIYFGGQQIAEYEGGTTVFHHNDHLGSTRLLTGLNQSVAQNIDYLPFGELLASNSWNTDHFFTGDERDAETNLDHTWFRQYSSQLGRWMHPDPAGLASVDITNPQSWNRYAYVTNDPMDYIDPSGLGPCPNDQSWSAQLCNQAVAFGGTFYYNTWNEFLALETALTPTSGGELVQDPSVMNTCPPGGDCSLWVQTPLVYGNLGALSILNMLNCPPPLICINGRAGGSGHANVGGPTACTTALTGVVSCQTLGPSTDPIKLFVDNLAAAACIGTEMGKSYTEGDNGAKAVYTVLVGFGTAGVEGAGIAAGADLTYEASKASAKCSQPGAIPAPAVPWVP